MTSSENPPRPTVHIPNPVHLYVIFDGPPEHESGRFVEVEDENGQGVSAGKWEERGDGFWTLGPFLQPPAEVAEQPATDLGTMVEAILAEATFPEFRKADRMELSVKLSAIHGTAQHLKTALAQREEVVGGMAKVLKGLSVGHVAFCDCSVCIALSRYERG